ncbi:MAG: homoserine dehydrogenase, partial [Halapricum sp.]
MDLSIVGSGVVGRSVAELAGEYGHRVTAMADSSSSVSDADGLDVTAVLDRKDTEGTVGTDDPEAALEADYDVLVEATPTTLGDAQPGFGHVEAALERDRHVVLANKGPVAERFADVMALAEASEGEIRFEATVGGAIPVLSTIEDYGPGTMTA